MLTVTLVATFAAAALWQQWRVGRGRGRRAGPDAGRLGADRRARLVAADPARGRPRRRRGGGGADYLAEPWAIPLEEAKLTTFLAADKNIASDALEGLPDAFLSGRIVDAQSKLNVFNLVNGGKPVAASVDAFKKLFQLLGLPAEELALMTANLQRALPAAASDRGHGHREHGDAARPAARRAPRRDGQHHDARHHRDSTAPTPITGSATGPLMPQRTAQLVWLGLSPATVAALEPYVTVLPTRTPLNLNTASAEAIFASMPTLDLAGAKRLVAAAHPVLLQDAGRRRSAGASRARRSSTPDQHSVGTRYFEVQARLRIDRTWVEEQTAAAARRPRRRGSCGENVAPAPRRHRPDPDAITTCHRLGQK